MVGQLEDRTSVTHARVLARRAHAASIENENYITTRNVEAAKTLKATCLAADTSPILHKGLRANNDQCASVEHEILSLATRGGKCTPT